MCTLLLKTNCGLGKIEVRDNGTGIKKDQVKFAAKPHFTSKLSSVDDLSHLASYGFRGEALGWLLDKSYSSLYLLILVSVTLFVGGLCAVSDVTITTRTSSCDVGFSYEINHLGEITSAKVSHFPQGT